MSSSGKETGQDFVIFTLKIHSWTAKFPFARFLALLAFFTSSQTWVFCMQAHWDLFKTVMESVSLIFFKYKGKFVASTQWFVYLDLTHFVEFQTPSEKIQQISSFLPLLWQQHSLHSGTFGNNKLSDVSLSLSALTWNNFSHI